MTIMLMYNLIIFIFYFFIFITVYQLYKNVVTLIFPLVIFLWTTWGGIIFQLNLSGIFFGPEHYQYLFQKLAVVRYGSDFILANLIYGVGIVTCLSTYFFTLRNQKRNLIKLNYNNLNFPTSQVLTLIIICFILFIFLVYPQNTAIYFLKIHPLLHSQVWRCQLFHFNQYIDPYDADMCGDLLGHKKEKNYN